MLSWVEHEKKFYNLQTCFDYPPVAQTTHVSNTIS